MYNENSGAQKVLWITIIHLIFTLTGSLFAQIDLDEFKKLINAQDGQKLDQFKIEYDIECKALSGHDDFTKASSSPESGKIQGGSANGTVFYDFACILERDYKKYKYTVEDKLAKVIIEYCSDGKIYWRNFPKTKVCQIDLVPGSFLPAPVDEFLFHYPSTSSGPFSPVAARTLSEMLANENAIVKLDKDRLCIREKIKPNWFRVSEFVMKPEIGYLPISYSSHGEVDGAPFDPVVSINYNYKSFDGNWLPNLIEIKNIGSLVIDRSKGKDRPQPEAYKSYELDQVTIKVKSVELNKSFDPDTFKFKILPNTTVIDKIADERFEAINPSTTTKQLSDELKRQK